MVKIPAGMPQNNIPTNPAEQGLPAGQPSPVGQTQIPVDQLGDFPTAEKSVAKQMTPEKIVSELNVLVQNITVKANVIIAAKGDVDVNLPGKLHLDLANLDKMYPSVGNFILETKEPTPKKFKPIFVGLKAVGQAIQAGQNSSFPGICQKPKPDGRVFAPKQNIGDCLASSGQALKPEFITHFETFTSQNLPQDPMAFIQWVLRESYLETTACLYDYAEKVQWFNDQKKAVRLEAEGVRNALAPYAGTKEEDKATTKVNPAIDTKNFNLEYYGDADANAMSDRIKSGQFNEEVTHETVTTQVGGGAGTGTGGTGSAGLKTDLDLQDAGVKAAIEAADADGDGKVSGPELLTIIKAAEDLDAQAAGKEYSDIVKFYEANKALMSPEAKAVFAKYKSTMDAYKAEKPSATGMPLSQFNTMIDDLGSIADPAAGYAADAAATEKTTHDSKSYGGKKSGSESQNLDMISDYAAKLNGDVDAYLASLSAEERTALEDQIKANGGVSISGSGVEYDSWNPNDTVDGVTIKEPLRAGESLEDYFDRVLPEVASELKRNFEKEAGGTDGDAEIENYNISFSLPGFESESAKYTAEELATKYPNNSGAQNAAAGQSATGEDIGTFKTGDKADSVAELETYLENLEETLNTLGDDAQLANVDLQNWLQKQQQTMQMMSNISKMLQDTAMAIIRKIG